MHRTHRLRANADFQRLRQRGQRTANGLLVLNYAPNAAGGQRFGFVVGKKVGGAVQRNRVKRRLREQLRRHMQAGRLRGGMDVVIVVRQGAAQRDADTLAAALDELLGRARLWQRGE